MSAFTDARKLADKYRNSDKVMADLMGSLMGIFFAALCIWLICSAMAEKVAQ